MVPDNDIDTMETQGVLQSGETEARGEVVQKQTEGKCGYSLGLEPAGTL